MKPRLLIMDDQKPLRDAISAVLCDYFEVSCAKDLAEAREWIFGGVADSPFSVILADMVIDGEDEQAGITLARELAALEIRPEIVVLTAYPSYDHFPKLMQNLVFSYVEKGKPNTPKQVIEQCLGAHARWVQQYVRMPDDIEEVAECLVLIDIIGSTGDADLYGWSVTGRNRLYRLRRHIVDTCTKRGLTCRKFTGDGYLLAFRHERSADLAVLQALDAMCHLARQVAAENATQPGHQYLPLRYAFHFGQVDAVPHDREGLAVAFTFRLESAAKTARMRKPDAPKENFAVLSRSVAEIIRRHLPKVVLQSLGRLELKGFRGLHEVSLLEQLQDLEIDARL